MIEFLKKHFRLIYTFVDVAFIICAYAWVCVVVMESDGSDGGLISKGIVTTVLTCVLYLVASVVSGAHKNILRYMGMRDLAVEIFTCAAVFVVAAFAAIFWKEMLMRSEIVLLTGCIALALMFMFRIFVRQSYVMSKMRKKEPKTKRRALVIGGGEAAMVFLDDIFVEHKEYEIVGLIDDDSSRLGGRIRGVEVIGNRFDIEKICREKEVEEIFFCILTIDAKEKAKILKICSNTGCRIRVMPGVSDLSLASSIYRQTKKVSIEELLEREAVKLDISEISAYIKDRCVVVTGGGGSIGSELCRQIAKFKPKKLIIIDIYENTAYTLEQEMRYKNPQLDFEVIIASVRDKKRIKNIFETRRPDIVFHAAAHKHVPLMENNPTEAVKNNIFGTYNCAVCASEAKVKRFVLISTDKAVNPTNIMGATKRVCEMIIQSINEVSGTEFVAVRFGNVLGSNGSVVPLFKAQIEAGGPVTLTHKEVTRFFMTIPEATQLVLQAGACANGGEIFVLDMGEPVKIYDLAVNLITLSGLKPGVDIPIKITGLRPGEKLYEELLMSEEGLSDTKHEKIYIAKPMHFEWKKLNEKLDIINKYAYELDNDEVKKVLKELVPTFRKDDTAKKCDGKGENLNFVEAVTV